MRKPAWLAGPHRPLYLLLVGALAGVAIWGLWPRAVAVESAEVVRGPLIVSFVEEGRTRLRDRYLIGAPLDGMLERIPLEPGDAVKAGDAVATLHPSHAALFDPATRSAAEARWRVASDELEAANAVAAGAAALRDRLQAARGRADALAARQLVAIDQRDEIRAQAAAAQASLRSARARVQAARIQRDSAREVLDLQGAASREGGRRLRLPAPLDARVIRRFVESEGYVRAGQALLELGDPRMLEVVVEALTEDAMRIRPGTKVELLRWGGDAPLRGRVHAIEPGGFTKVSALGVEEQRVLVVVAFDDQNGGRPPLGDGFRVEARFHVWQTEAALQVPVAALFRDGQDWAVYAVERGRARLRKVRIGQFGEDRAEVRDGLAQGSRVVLYPGDVVREGVRVKSE